MGWLLFLLGFALMVIGLRSRVYNIPALERVIVFVAGLILFLCGFIMAV